MNISDYQPLLINKGEDRFKKMLELHKEIQKTFEMQEEIDFSVAADQDLLRWIAWNVVEETGELMFVFESGLGQEHLLDEVADATGFFLELLNFSKIEDFFILKTPEKSKTDLLSFLFEEASKKEPFEAHSDFVTKLALTMNTLKNRKWRKTNLLTDLDAYHKRLRRAIEAFFTLLISVGINDKILWDCYTRKCQVNKARRRTNY